MVAKGVFATLFPSDCRLCGIPLENISRLPVCRSCLLAMTPISGDMCEVCGENLPGLRRQTQGRAPQLASFANTGTECAACQQEKPHFAKAAADGPYDGGLRELIHLLKYEQVEPAVGVLAGMLADAIGKLNIGPDSFLVIPVPLHSGKRRQRGFNQAELIAHRALRRVAMPQARFTGNVLERTRATVSQIGLTRPERSQNIRGAFRVVHPSRVSGRDVLLVDDVLTTGTTASECARVLRKAGARHVWVATVARTLKNQEVFEIEPRSGIASSAAQAS